MLVAYKIEKKLGNHNCAVDVTATWSPEETDLNVQAVEALPPDDVDVCQSLSSWAPRFAPRVYGLWLPCERRAYLDPDTTEEEAVVFAATWARAVKTACEVEIARVRTFAAISREGGVS